MRLRYFFALTQGKKMGWKISFLLLALIAESSNLFYANAIICEIAVFMTSFLKKQVQLITSAPDIEITTG